jgi:hypothetical protein
MNIPNNFSESLETFSLFSGLKTLIFFDADPDPVQIHQDTDSGRTLCLKFYMKNIPYLK